MTRLRRQIDFHDWQEQRRRRQRVLFITLLVLATGLFIGAALVLAP